MATEKALMKVKWFILYGSEMPLCRPDPIMNKIKRLLHKSDCPALVNLIEVGNGEKAMKQVKSVISASITSDPTRCGYYKSAALFALVLLIKSKETQPYTKSEAYSLFHVVCVTSEELFLFHHFLVAKQNENRAEEFAAAQASTAISRPAAERGAEPEARAGQRRPAPDPVDPPEAADAEPAPTKRKRAQCSTGLKRAMNKWYNSKDTLSLAKDSTGVVHRFGQSHANIIQALHVAPESKALQIVFSCIAVRGKANYRKKDLILEELVEKFEKMPNANLDEETVKVLNYYKGLKKLYALVSGNKKLKKEERKTMLNGPIADDAGHVLTENQIPLFTGVPYEFWVSPVVSEALIPHMTIRQILDRLPYLSHLKLIPAQPENPDPCQILVDRSKMTSERIHPFQVLAGMRRYEAAIFREVPTIKAKPDEENPEGKNLKARPTTITSWDVSDKVISAGVEAFDIALEVMPAIVGRRLLVAIDVNKANRDDKVTGGNVGLDSQKTIAVITSILNYQCGGREGRTAEQVKEAGEATATTPAEGGYCHVLAFSRKVVPSEVSKSSERSFDISSEPLFPTMELSPTQGFCDIVGKMDSVLTGDVDVSALIRHCQENELRYDAILVLAGKYSTPRKDPPKAALKLYREAMNLPMAKLCVVGTSSNMFSVADVEDDHMLDVVGFGVNCAEQIADFLTR